MVLTHVPFKVVGTFKSEDKSEDKVVDESNLGMSPTHGLSSPQGKFFYHVCKHVYITRVLLLHVHVQIGRDHQE
jgi:hypothetical protein